MSNDAPTRLILLSSDGNWLLKLSEVLGQLGPRTYQAASSAFAELQSDVPTVLVAAPSDLTSVLQAPPETYARRNVAVLALVESATVAVLRHAMAAGVADVLETTHLPDLPRSVEDLSARVQRAAAEPAAAPTVHAPGRIIAVTSAKSGQGATTVAVNLALSLTKHGSVALVEGDPRFGDLLAALGYRQQRHTLEPSPDVLSGHWFADRIFRHPSGLLVVIPEVTSPEELRTEDVLDAMAALQSTVDRVVVDVPLLMLEQHRLHRASDALLLVSRDRIRDLAHASVAVRSVGLDPQDCRLVVSTYVDGRTPKRADMRAMTGLEPIARIPESGVAAGEALDDGIPIVEHDESHPLRPAFAELTDAVVAMTS